MYYICKLCGTRLEFLTEFHAKQHNMTLEEYKAKDLVQKVTFRDFKFTKSHYDECDAYEINKTYKFQKKALKSESGKRNRGIK